MVVVLVMSTHPNLFYSKLLISPIYLLKPAIVVSLWICWVYDLGRDRKVLVHIVVVLEALICLLRVEALSMIAVMMNRGGRRSLHRDLGSQSSNIKKKYQHRRKKLNSYFEQKRPFLHPH